MKEQLRTEAENRNVIKEEADKYQDFFNFLSQEHNLTPTISEMDEIVSEAKKFVEKYNTDSDFHAQQSKPNTEAIDRLKSIIEACPKGSFFRKELSKVLKSLGTELQQSKDFYKNENFDAKCDDACKFTCTKGNTQEAECLNDEQVQFTFDPPKEQKLKIPKIIEILWSLKDSDKFYFQSYGEDVLKSLVKQDVDSDKFISVSERLPETAGKYLGYVINTDNDLYSLGFQTVQYEYNRWYSINGLKSNEKVTHWQPLPTSPL